MMNLDYIMMGHIYFEVSRNVFDFIIPLPNSEEQYDRIAGLVGCIHL